VAPVVFGHGAGFVVGAGGVDDGAEREEVGAGGHESGEAVGGAGFDEQEGARGEVPGIGEDAGGVARRQLVEGVGDGDDLVGGEGG